MLGRIVHYLRDYRYPLSESLAILIAANLHPVQPCAYMRLNKDLNLGPHD